MDHLRKEYPVKMLCDALDVSRSGYYDYQKRPNKDKDIEELISYIYDQYEGVLGVRGIEMRLREDYCWKVNHKKVHRVMKKLELKAIIRKKRRYKNHRQKSGGMKYENLLKQDFYAENPMEKLVTDVTEFKVNHTTLYLSSILDLFNNEIISYQLSQENDIKLVEDTIHGAFKRIGTVHGAILHSDQGMQYRSNKYYELSKEYNFTPSMSRKGTCLDNASAEGFFSHFKAEAFHLFSFKTVKQAYKSVDEYIKYYNNQRYQKRLKSMSPAQYFNHYFNTAVA
nr:IS3 family transposase [Aquibacillus sediminis]